MPADVPLYQAILAQIQASTTGCGVRRSAAKRLALLVTGIVAARSSVLAQVAAELWALRVSAASEASIGRRLRRTLNDPSLTPARCYTPLLRTVIDWPQALRRHQT